MPRYFIRFCIEHVSKSSTKKYYSRTVNIIKCMNFITLSIVFKFILINRFDRKSLKIKFITDINDITSFFFQHPFLCLILALLDVSLCGSLELL